ncbi:MAG: alkaline phosphatase family protein, partial [Bryobacterales bacterium]|nr:alkaline phosphatase family protein [Bryobacterales bacterium]
MNSRYWWIGLFALFVSALSGQVAPKDRVVILISIDGLPAYAWQDQRLLAPNLTRLATEGVKAEGMIPPNPTLTWPSHTTMITGVSPAKHGLLYNGRPAAAPPMKPLRIESWIPKEELVQFPTLYDRLFQAGFTTAEVDWVAIFQAKTITWAFPEIPVVNGPIEKEMAAAGILSSNDAANFFQSTPVWRDEQWTNAAVHILKQHKPNLLMYHLLNVDSVSHTAGPRTPASATAYAQADAHVGRL